MQALRRRDLAWLAALFAAYVGAHRLGESVIQIDKVSPVWPASGVAIAGLLLLGWRAAPVIVAADLTGAWLDAESLAVPVACGTALASLAEAVVVVWLLRLAGFDLSIQRWRDVLTLAAASAAGAASGALLGVAVLMAGDVVDGDGFGVAFRSWALGDAVGDLAVVSLVGVWRTLPNWKLRHMEWALGLPVFVAACLLAFSGDVEMLYILFPFLIWGPMRFGRHGATLVTLIAGAIAIWLTAEGSGPFARDDPVAGLVSLQVFLGVILLTELALAAVRHERGVADAELRRLALYDRLTNLPNRTLLSDRIRQAAGSAERRDTEISVLFVDVDRFKTINDGLGPGAGDELLCRLAERLGSLVRVGDTLGRFGGDQFVVVCEDCPVHESARLAAQIVDSTAKPLAVAGDEVYASVSIGIARGLGANRPEVLLRNAGAAMNRAKRRGGGTFEIYDEAERADVRERLSLEAALRKAIERSQLRVHFQPVVALADGHIETLEALVRWEHPDEGLIGPDEFIPLAEETGLIVGVGEWVLDRACRELATWPPDVGVSVNVSPVQVARCDVVELIRSKLAEHGIEPRRFTVEITESALERDVAEVLEGVRALGSRVSLDDFGVGYASLGDIHNFPLDSIKIDRRFVADLAPGSREQAIIGAVTAMAGALGMRTVAEGVETHEQLELVTRLGCDYAQGYVLSRPVPAAAVPEMLSAGVAPSTRSISSIASRPTSI